MDIASVQLGWILFAGTHIGLGSYRIRKALIDKLGERMFQGVYSLVALATFAFLCFAYAKSTDETPFIVWGKDSRVMLYLCDFTMLLGFIVFFCGFFNPTPLGMKPVRFDAFGVTRITRHPQNMGFALFGLSHLFTNRLAVDWIFFGGFVLFGYLGSMHQDRRKVREIGSELEDFVSQTSITPFWAILTRVQRLNFGELSKIGLVLGIAATVIARILHPSILERLLNVSL